MTKENVLDLSTIGVNATATIELNDELGDPLFNSSGNRVSITVYGPGSKQFQKAQSIRQNAAMDNFAKRLNKKSKNIDDSELDAEFLASCTVSFNNLGYKDLTGTEMFKAAYLDPAITFIKEQVNKFAGDYANFTKKSAKS